MRTTITAKKATFFSRSRQQWTKGRQAATSSPSNPFILIVIRTLSSTWRTDGPTCHTGAHTCYFSRVDGEAGAAEVEDGGRFGPEEALSTLYELEETIKKRREEVVDDGTKPSWTRRLELCARRSERKPASSARR